VLFNKNIFEASLFSNVATSKVISCAGEVPPIAVPKIVISSPTR